MPQQLFTEKPDIATALSLLGEPLPAGGY